MLVVRRPTTMARKKNQIAKAPPKKHVGTVSYLEPLDTPTRRVAVINALAEMIECAGLELGDRLPPKLAMAATLGVGRSTIRETLNCWNGPTNPRLARLALACGLSRITASLAMRSPAPKQRLGPDGHHRYHQLRRRLKPSNQRSGHSQSLTAGRL